MFVLFFSVFAFSFYLYNLPFLSVLYPFVICTVLGLIYLVCDFLNARKKHNTLSIIKKTADVTIDSLPSPETATDEDFAEIIFSLQSLSDELATNADIKYNNTLDYFTIWAHQIKTPLAAMKLKLQNEDSPLSRQLQNELLRVEQYVEMVLTFLRLGSDSTDYRFCKCNIDDILKSSVKKLKGEFIDRKLKIDYRETSLTVLTDEKWLSFVIEQVLSNALKYTLTGSISIYSETDILYIKDTGIGISPEDVPRVFENGFTGFNGRTDKKATGIGLFLCKQICKNLGIDISLTSKVNEGTVVAIDFSMKNVQTE